VLSDSIEGNYSSGDSKIENVPILKTDWQSVLNAVTKELKFLESSEDSSLSRVRILKDLVIAFEIHGYITCSWFLEMQPVKIETNELSFFAKIDLKS
jgi:hypothetical protein